MTVKVVEKKRKTSTTRGAIISVSALRRHRAVLKERRPVVPCTVCSPKGPKKRQQTFKPLKRGKSALSERKDGEVQEEEGREGQMRSG